MKSPPSVPLQAIVLGRKAYGEADWILTLFTREKGLLRAIAPHGRASRKRFGGALDLFCRVQVELARAPAKGRGGEGTLERMASAELLEPYLGLRSSLEALETAALSCEALACLTHEHEVLPGLFGDLSALLSEASRPGGVGQAVLRVWFFLRLLSDAGMAPQVSACVRCGKGPGEFPEALFSSGEGGILCGACAGALGPKALPAAGVRILAQVAASDLPGLAGIRVSAKGAGHLEELIRAFVEDRAGRPLKRARPAPGAQAKGD